MVLLLDLSPLLQEISGLSHRDFVLDLSFSSVLLDLEISEILSELCRWGFANGFGLFDEVVNDLYSASVVLCVCLVVKLHHVLSLVVDSLPHIFVLLESLSFVNVSIDNCDQSLECVSLALTISSCSSLLSKLVSEFEKLKDVVLSDFS